MVKYLQLALAFTALLNSVMVSAFLLPISQSVSGGASATISVTTTSSLTSTTPTTVTSNFASSSMGTSPTEPTVSTSSTVENARLLKSRQVHNADYAANKNGVADSSSPAPESTEPAPDVDSSTVQYTENSNPASPTAAYDERK
ncbi:hypothetical protein SCHPADRAFT_923526 [Schizopora paradoxa]|uniref:Uncharacterized protein n=1 Tax=Schizopora paradoxa TaxID=27342 RepID=A0A0H2S7T9_9AGAM|nr:hypothetical protein SCHPADRAFT_923526 [Schizopora paradoxa]